MGFKNSVCVEKEEADAWEEDRNEIVIDDLLDIAKEDIGILLHSWQFKRFLKIFVFLNRIFSLQKAPLK